MIDRERMVKEFTELVQIDSLSFKERKMADRLKSKLSELNVEFYEDDAGTKIGGNAGNIIATIRGDKNIPAILLMAHMDTVVPGEGKKPVIEGDIIKSDGKTILGADDVSGIECILECIRVLKSEEIKHGDIYIVFSVAEEAGLHGAKNLDYSKIPAKYGFALDSGGDIGEVIIEGPTQNIMHITVKGKAAHAGIEPEKGISAIQIASEAIAGMKLGRIDNETTANIGIINGGKATNIVCDEVILHAEARSRQPKKLEEQTQYMKECFMKAAEKFGGSVEFKADLMYPAFEVKENDKIVSILKKAAQESGVELKLEATGGGSDTNIIAEKGIEAVNISVGMKEVHSVDEYIKIDDLVKAANFLLSIIKNVE
jgi:tripeptide aminopeptidase